MASESIDRLLGLLDELKRPSINATSARLENVLSQLSRRRFTEAEQLIRFHESLLFLRAYPRDPNLVRQVESILKSFAKRVEVVLKNSESEDAFAEPEVSGIVGTSLTANFSYHIARWLANRHGRDVSIDFDGYEDGARLGETLPRFIPLLEEESLVEANVSYATWIESSKGAREKSLSWLVSRFECLTLSAKEKSELYDSLKLYLKWNPRRFSISRTGMRLKTPSIFFHNGPLLARRDVSIKTELNSPKLPIEKLSPQNGQAMLDLIRDTSTIRFRELHGFTYGDCKHVIRAYAGRGVEFFTNGVEPEFRLPLRAYHSVFMVKNGVPIGYVEGLSLFERMEIGFNIYYTFREGESAWLYARVLKLFQQLLGVTTFSVDPYQIGFENEEGIESGAFWFYRKLGFRPVNGSIRNLVEAEERKMADKPGYRSSVRRLKQMAKGHMLVELGPNVERAWDHFQIRNLGLAVARKMTANFGGDQLKMRHAAIESVERSLEVKASRWSDSEQVGFGNLALVLSLFSRLSDWTASEKKLLIDIIRAKAGAAESQYLRLMQKHSLLRAEIIKLGR